MNLVPVSSGREQSWPWQAGGWVIPEGAWGSQQVQLRILEGAVGTGGLAWALERAGGLPQLAQVLFKMYHED